MKTKQKITPEEIIAMALGSNKGILDRATDREGEDKLYEAARRSNIVRPRPAIQIGGDVEAPLPGGPASTEPVSSAPMAGNDVQRLAQSLAASEYGWSGPEWDALYNLVQKESSWNPNAKNPSSSASGLFQFISSTGKAYGLPSDARQASVEQQIRAGLRYIAERYKSPTGALRHWQSKVPINGRNVGHWY